MTGNEVRSRHPARGVEPPPWARAPLVVAVARLGANLAGGVAAAVPPAAMYNAPRPLAFEANHGQTDAQVRFVARGRRLLRVPHINGRAMTTAGVRFRQPTVCP